ncbi:Coiled-coil domain-containing protein 13 [Phlyctochytrium planicorne]|nr:Coiled-coil domain-containing protein 13 [Phlyctochytrium planicorne]
MVESSIKSLPSLNFGKDLTAYDKSWDDLPLHRSKDEKIIELAKKVRRLNMAWEREKVTNSKLVDRIKELKDAENELQKRSESEPKRLVEECQNCGNLSLELKACKDRLTAITRRLEDERSQSKNLKTELQNAQKALVMEIGADVPVVQILKTGGGWRGRSQKIAMLQEKIKELSTAVARSQPQTKERTEATILEERIRDPLAEVNSIRRKDYERLSQELKNLQDSYKDIKTKYESSSSRNKYLDSELKRLKDKMTILVQKSERDDILISRLQAALRRKKTADSSN